MADKIAQADVDTDNNGATAPLNPTNAWSVPRTEVAGGQAEWSSATRWYHFMGQDRSDLRAIVAATTPGGDVQGFGQALHLFQDTYSHIESDFTMPVGHGGGG